MRLSRWSRNMYRRATHRAFRISACHVARGFDFLAAARTMESNVAIGGDGELRPGRRFGFLWRYWLGYRWLGLFRNNVGKDEVVGGCGWR